MGESRPLNAAVLGGGILGTALAYKLAKKKIRVTLYERGETPGGLAGTFNYEGVRLDLFYHAILTSDTFLHSLINESGLSPKLHCVRTKQGFYHDGIIHPFNSAFDVLRYVPLALPDRLRLGLQIAGVLFEQNSGKDAEETAGVWLVRTGGRAVWEKVWLPLLRTKFGQEAESVPAAYIRSRLKRTLSTRKSTALEAMCYLETSYVSLVEALAREAALLGARIKLKEEVREVLIRNGRAHAVKSAGGTESYDVIVSTLPPPVFSGLVPDAPADFLMSLREQKYLGVLCPLLVLRSRLTPYYVINITDETIPFTAVVETTTLIPTNLTGGHHLVYLPKYLPQDHPMWDWSAERVRAEWMSSLMRMFPSFDRENLKDVLIHRARFVEPLMRTGKQTRMKSFETMVSGLYLVNTSMVFPDVNSGEAVTRLASGAAELIASLRAPSVPL